MNNTIKRTIAGITIHVAIFAFNYFCMALITNNLDFSSWAYDCRLFFLSINSISQITLAFFLVKVNIKIDRQRELNKPTT